MTDWERSLAFKYLATPPSSAILSSSLLVPYGVQCNAILLSPRHSSHHHYHHPFCEGKRGRLGREGPEGRRRPAAGMFLSVDAAAAATAGAGSANVHPAGKEKEGAHHSAGTRSGTLSSLPRPPPSPVAAHVVRENAILSRLFSLSLSLLSRAPFSRSESFVLFLLADRPRRDGRAAVEWPTRMRDGDDETTAAAMPRRGKRGERASEVGNILAPCCSSRLHVSCSAPLLCCWPGEAKSFDDPIFPLLYHGMGNSSTQSHSSSVNIPPNIFRGNCLT